MSTEWSIPEKIQALKLSIDKLTMWPERVAIMEQMFGNKHPPGFFTQHSLRRELHLIFNQSKPAHIQHIPMHSQGREAAELWLNYYHEQLHNEQEKTKQLFWVGIRSTLDLIQKYKSGKLSVDYLKQLRDQHCDLDKDNKLVNDCVNMFMEKAKVSDLKNVATTDDLLQLVRGEHVAERLHPPTAPVMPVRASPLKSPLRSPVRPTMTAASPRAVKAPSTPVASPTRQPAATTALLDGAATKSQPTTMTTRSSAVTSPRKAAATQVDLPARATVTPTPAAADVHDEMEVDEPSIADTPKSHSPKQIQTRSSRRPAASAAAIAATPTLSKTKERVRPAAEKSSVAQNTRAATSSAVVADEPAVVANTPTVSTKSTTAKVTHPLVGEEKAAPPRKIPRLAQDETKSTPISRLSTKATKTPKDSKKPSPAAKELLQQQLSATPSSSTSIKEEEPPLTPKENAMPTPEIGLSTTKRLRRSAAIAAAVNASMTTPRRSVTGTGYTPNEVVGRGPLLTVLREMMTHRVAGIFLAPVRADDVPGYSDAVKRPMDLTTIRRQIESGAIETFAQLHSAIVLMFANAIMFNSTDHDVNTAAKDMLQYALRQIINAQYPCGEFGEFLTAPSRTPRSTLRSTITEEEP